MEYIKLGEIAKIVAGSTAPKENQFNDSTGLPFIRAGHLEALCNNYDLNRLPRVDESNKDIKKQVRVPKNTIVFAKSGMSCMKARVYQTTEESYIVNHLAGIICSEKVNPSYLKYYFMINKPNRLVIDESYPSIRLSDISNMNIYIPNLEIQLKIANILDKANNLIDKRKEQIESLDELVKSRFIEMFGNVITNSNAWETELLGEICDLKAGKNIKAKDIYENNSEDLYPCYGGNGLRGYVKNYSHEGNINLIGRQGALCGNVKYAKGKFYATEHAVVTQPKVSINSYWLYYVLTELDLNRLSTGAAQPGLTVGKLNEVEIPKVPIELQNQFADFVKQVDKLKFEMEKSLKELEDNFNSLMQKAFKGELF